MSTYLLCVLIDNSNAVDPPEDKVLLVPDSSSNSLSCESFSWSFLTDSSSCDEGRLFPDESNDS